jgi:hypothetical protein
MTLEDRIRSSVETALGELTAHLDQDARALVQQLVTAASDDRDDAIAVVRRDAAAQAAAVLQREIEDTEIRVRATMDEAVEQARTEERMRAASDRQHLVDAEMAALGRLLDSVRGLDGAASLSDVLDVLGQAAGREASRAAVLLVRNDRLQGWRLSGFGAADAQPNTVDLGLDEGGVVATAVSTARRATTRDEESATRGPAFAQLPIDRQGLAVPVIVGGRTVAVVYADSVPVADRDQVVPSGWPEAIELLARHAARCLEALAVQRTASPQSPRFWVPGTVRQAVEAGKRVGETPSSSGVAPPGVMT